MEQLLTFGFILLTLLCFIQFAQKEAVEEEFTETIDDVEGRLDWAGSRRFYPFGMQAQLELSRRQLRRAKEDWQSNNWHQAYLAAQKSQEAMNRAQQIYRRALASRYRAETWPQTDTPR